MSRKLLIGSTEYAWPNDGDLNWGQDVFDWAEAISKAVTEGSGGGGTSFTVGTGLTLSNDVLSISDSGVDTAQLADESVTEAKLNITNTGTAGQILSYAGANNFEWVAASEAGVEDLSGVRGGSGITVTHTQSNEIATVAVVGSIQNALVPRGGAPDQVLAKQSGADHDLYWRNDAHTTYSAGQGLELNDSNEFIIPDHSISYSLINRDIWRYTFGAEVSLGFEDDIEIDGLNNVDLETDSDGTIYIFPRDTGTTFYELVAGTHRTHTFTSSDSTSEFGTAIRGDIIYRCTYDSSNQEITHLRAFNLDGTRRAQSDITIATPISIADTNDATYFIYNEFHQRFYFTAGEVIWYVLLDGVSDFDDSLDEPGTQMIDMDQYIAFVRPGFFNQPELFVYDPSELDQGGGLHFITQFHFPLSSLDEFRYYNIIKDGEFFYALTRYQKDSNDVFTITTFYAYNGPIDRDLVDQVITPAKLRTTNLNATDGQILSLDGNSFTWVDATAAEIADGSIQPVKLSTTNTGTNRQILSLDGTDFTWVNVPTDTDTTYTAGQGLALSNSNEFSIPDEAITYPLLPTRIRNFIFQAPVEHSAADLTLSGLDESHLVRISNVVLASIPRGSTNEIDFIGYDGRDVEGIVFGDSDSTSEYGVTYNTSNSRFYRPTVSGTTITHLRAYNVGGGRETGEDITLNTAIPDIDDIRTSLVYNIYVDAFYFLSGNKIYHIDFDGNINAILTKTFVDGTIIESMDNYLCEYNINYDGGEQSYSVYQLERSGGFSAVKGPFILGRPEGITTGYSHYNIIKSGPYFYSLVGYQKGLSEAYTLTQFFAGNGCFELELSDVLAVERGGNGGTTYTAGAGLTLSNSNEFSIGDGQITIPMLSTNNEPASGRFLAIDGADRLFWSLAEGARYAGPSNLPSETIFTTGVTQLTEEDHLNKIVPVLNTSPSSTPFTLKLPDIHPQQQPRFFCRVYIIDNKNDVAVRSPDTGRLEVSNPNRGIYGLVTNDVYLGNSRFTSVGQVLDIYTAFGDAHVYGALRLNRNDDLSRPTLADNSVEYNKLVDAEQYVDNGGVIEPTEGFENMALVFKRQVGVGTPNEEWVPTNLDYLFELRSQQVGTASDAPHNYDLRFAPGAIRGRDILDPLAIDNLIGVNFFQNPATDALGQIYRPRLTTPWHRSDTTVFNVAPNQVAVIGGLKRTASTRNVTHMLVRAGRAAGITNATSNEDAINAATNEANVYHEIFVPLSVSFTNANAVAVREARKNYVILTEAGMEFSVQTVINTSGILTVELSVCSVGQTLKGDEFITFHAVRSIGG